MPFTLSQLVTVLDQASTWSQIVIPELQKRKVRVTDWVVGGVYRAMGYVVSKLSVDAQTIVATYAAALFGDYCFGFVQTPSGIDVTSWAPLVAKQCFGVDRIEATYTVRNITLTNTSTTPQGPLGPGGMIISFPSGNRYILGTGAPDDATSITIPASDSVIAPFRSEFANDSAAGLSYNDASGLTISLVTANFPGVTATNPAPSYSSVSHVGGGIGTVTPSATPSGSHHIAVRIDTQGNTGVATWSTSLDGAAYVTQSNASSITNYGGLGITITLANNGGSPAFLAGDVYYFDTPGSDITTKGRDVETPHALGLRCYATRPMLAFVRDPAGNWVWTSPTINAYEALALLASTQVVVALAQTDGAINNVVRILVASQGGPALPAVVATVQAFLTSRAMLTDRPIVATPVARVVNVAGATVTCKAALIPTAKAAMNREYQAYFSGLDPSNPLSVNPKLEHAVLVELARGTIGVIGFTDTALTIGHDGGSYAAADLQLPITPSTFEMATWSEDVANVFTWVPG